ncbi:MAG: hypothetical protein IKM86_06440 [Acidaminococcaceae bacterium]|nr:hypothetical protein [Acidaminococcaceae bacterium]
MKKQIMASVLLASIVFAVPGYAAYALTPDDYDSDDKYKSPLEQSYGPVVNDHPKAESADEGEVFALAAEQLIQRDASNKDVSGQNTIMKETSVTPEQDAAPADKTKKEKESKSDKVAAATKATLEKADQQAEKVLSETDDSFEPAQDKEYPGQEYQAGRQIKSYFESANFREYLQQRNNTVLESAEQKSSDGASLSVSHNDVKKTGTESSLARNKEKSVSSANKGNKKNEKTDTQPLPLIIKGDDAQYSSESGDFIIEGNVRLEQGLTNVTSTKAVGNANTGDIWLLEGGTLQEPTNRVNARWAHYNFNKETGELLHLKGASSANPRSGKFDYYEAPHGLIEHGMLIMDQGGMSTRCPAVKHHPCVSVKAKTITIIPNDRIIARGVQVFVKGKHVYSRDVWINELNKENKQTKPRIGWDNERGWYASLEYSRPIGNPLLKNPTTFYMEQIFYTKSKYKPFYGITHDRRDFYVRVNSGYVYDSDNDELDEGIWLHKKIDWGLFLKPHRIAKGLPLSIDGYITHGLWKYSNQNWESWHTEKAVFLRHDRFYPLGGKKLYMDLMVGRKWIHESLNNDTTRRYGNSLNTNIYHGTLGYRFSNKWNIWTTYHNEHRTSYLFSKDQPSFVKDLSVGIAWNPDQHNAFTIINRRNLDSETHTHGNYTTTFTWRHRFCCELLTVSYEKKHYNHENKWTVKFDFLSW